VEGQLTGADSFEIRTLVDTSYERIVNAMFDSLQQTAKLEGEGEDKGQLNYHVILIGNCPTATKSFRPLILNRREYVLFHWRFGSAESWFSDQLLEEGRRHLRREPARLHAVIDPKTLPEIDGLCGRRRKTFENSFSGGRRIQLEF
jgi:hypothetical protein